jgi:outer membrane protein OmpA-like peptidoglycan-associated protein
VLLLLLSTGTVSAQRGPLLQSGWEQAVWRVDSAPGQCLLTHAIPRFGTVRFEQRSGQPLSFSLLSEQPLAGDRTVSISAEAPAWKHHVESSSMRLPRGQASKIYRELERGMQPVIQIAARDNTDNRVRIALSPLRFRPALPAFVACTNGLSALDFEPLDERVVFFSTNSDRLSRSARRELEAVVQAWRKQRDARIVLGGHTDERGDSAYNLQLSRRRAASVARYLGSQGVPARVIESRYYGETRPSVPDSNRSAWLRNRRVTIWLAAKR